MAPNRDANASFWNANASFWRVNAFRRDTEPNWPRAMRNAVVAEAQAVVRELAQPCPPGDRVKAAVSRVALATGLGYRRVQTFWRGQDCAVRAEELETLRAARRARLAREARRLAEEQALLRARLAALGDNDAGLAAALAFTAREGGDGAGAPQHPARGMVAPAAPVAATAVRRA